MNESLPLETRAALEAITGNYHRYAPGSRIGIGGRKRRESRFRLRYTVSSDNPLIHAVCKRYWKTRQRKGKEKPVPWNQRRTWAHNGETLARELGVALGRKVAIGQLSRELARHQRAFLEAPCHCCGQRTRQEIKSRAGVKTPFYIRSNEAAGGDFCCDAHSERARRFSVAGRWICDRCFPGCLCGRPGPGERA